jgi:hypothetical protein
MNDECEMEKKCEDQICELNSGNEYVGIHWGSMNDAKVLCNQPIMNYSTFGILQHQFCVSQVFTFGQSWNFDYIEKIPCNWCGN